MKNKINILISVMVISFLVIFQNGCGIFKKKEKEWKPVTYKNAHFIHSVKWPGETIKIIAKWYTGDITNWKSIAEKIYCRIWQKDSKKSCI
ncbi:MAG TPA: hypothetical protein DD405_02425 [Desulfobacteraceae bacterium]|nr:hypothetical protein [Desulfobacteraceae bacterium]